MPQVRQKTPAPTMTSLLSSNTTQNLLATVTSSTPSQRVRAGTIVVGGPGARDSQSMVTLAQSTDGHLDIQQLSTAHGLEQRQIALLPAFFADTSFETHVIQQATPAHGSTDELTIILSKIGRSWYTDSTRGSALGGVPALYSRPSSELGPWQLAEPVKATLKRKLNENGDLEDGEFKTYNTWREKLLREG